MVHWVLRSRVEQMDRSRRAFILARHNLCQAADGFIDDLRQLCDDSTSAISVFDFAQVCDEADAAVSLLEDYLEKRPSTSRKAQAVASKIYEIRRVQECVLMQLRSQHELMEAPITTMVA
ncbi:MAG TPA: hypothetical protein VND92_08310 [Vicinamibacterales bacterium]|nr:hypothetical protein [Vicinamibacterales bacterium]